MRYNVIQLLKNIKFLLQHNLKEELQEQQYQTLLKVEDYCNYEAKENEISDSDRIKILDYNETVDIILEKPKSFCRFGDGEINIINGESIPFQKYDKKLAQFMLDVLKDENTDLYIGINYNYFHSTKNLNHFNRKFYLLESKKYRDFLIQHCSKKRTYIAAGFNQPYVFFDNFDCDEYYKKVKLLFSNRDLVIFAGEGILKNYSYNLFDLAKNITYIDGPKTDSFLQFDELLAKAKSFSKEKTLCFILGPTSKVLVYELAKEGYIAWDIGHMAKDYDMYMKKVEKNATNINSFYKPD